MVVQDDDMAVFGIIFGVGILIVGCIYGFGCYYRMRSSEPRVPELDQNNIESH